EREIVYNSHDILNGKATASGHVAVIGGGLVGVETAEYLSEQGAAVTVIEMLDGVAKDLGALRKICVMESLYTHHIET
ncbi:NAD-binding protein, partial [Erysipelatoclostridium ramosum]|uniref:FAD-dependent oxidoreductase n=1 Tax=Thomasclavelia ramosa TaxID=1547 RepID=UPI001D08A2EA